MAAIGLEGRGYLEVLINGEALPLEIMLMGGVLLSQHHLYHVPCGQITFVDPLRVTNTRFTPSDGSELVIRVGPNKEESDQYTFRVFNVKYSQENSQLRYTITFWLNYPKWFLRPGVKSESGNSGQVLSRIAARSGLKYRGVNTSDAQAWLPFADTECRFARRVSSFGYVNDTSCMLLGVTFDGTLHYKDMNGPIPASMPHLVHGAETQQAFFCTSWEAKSNSGLMNLLGGYKASLRHYDPVQGLMIDAQAVRTRKMTKSLNVNAGLRTEVGDGRIRVLPLAAGNKHLKSTQARNQNARLSLLLAQSVSVVTPFRTRIGLFEHVQFSNYLMDSGSAAERDPNTSGTYLVAGRAIYMGANLNYVERLQLIRDGYDADKSNLLIK